MPGSDTWRQVCASVSLPVKRGEQYPPRRAVLRAKRAAAWKGSDHGLGLTKSWGEASCGHLPLQAHPAKGS